jgi:predicted small lipoprotein YifL
MLRRTALLLTLVPLAGCGGGGPARPTARAAPAAAAPTPAAPSDAEVRDALHLPDRVPLRATGSAPAGQVRVVRGWLDELRRGQVARAARRFAIPSRFQNFDAVARIRTPSDALAVTATLPCGAKMTSVGGAAGFVVYEARLTDRPGGACGSGVGGVVRGAVLVRHRRMVEWYRLPDRSQPRRGEPAISNGPLV